MHLYIEISWFASPLGFYLPHYVCLLASVLSRMTNSVSFSFTDLCSALQKVQHLPSNLMLLKLDLSFNGLRRWIKVQ